MTVAGLRENPSQSSREDIDNFIRALSDTVDLDLDTSDIVKSKRLGVVREYQSNPRDLELWFTREETADRVLRERTDLVSVRKLRIDRKLSVNQAEALEDLYREARVKTQEDDAYKYFVYGPKDKPVLRRQLKKRR